MNQKSQYQYITKKFYIRYKKITLQKNYIEYKKILPKCISESKFFNNNFIINIIIIIITYTNININFYICSILSLQSDFLSQKSAIKETIMGIRRT